MGTLGQYLSRRGVVNYVPHYTLGSSFVLALINEEHMNM
jgi:hypothetical protein